MSSLACGGRLALAAALGSSFLALVPGDATATVTQVDGTIVPVMGGGGCGGNIQICLNNEEGGPTINAILDASQLPEVFLPNLTGNVTFKDVAEGAGFENSFGYYNVGDDITNTANLHPILGCGVSAATHTGEAAGYIVNAEPPNTATVNFATELSMGRYGGGFIGFYLITPEGNPSSNNCGDFQNGTDGLSLFGRIYFTQRDLNNDGDFVHSLTYTSPTFTDRFYFGFEDLFRGGDNDFEDMLIAVTGLTPPCAPSSEVCDGLDNDCDGLIDAADPTLTGTGGACTCDGVAMTCQGGPRQGVCRTGQTVCVAGGVIECQSTVSPSGETCNSLDDNCNGVVDDGAAGVGIACDGPDADACLEGFTTCSAGVISCGDTTGANTETCNGIDDDCNGTIDDGVPGLGVACDGPDGDLCAEGVTVCTGGAPGCDDATSTDQELCNGADDDCDGSIDESPVDVGVACSVGVGECARSGATICVGGAQVCNVSPGSPTAERCNGLDDDCDGEVDEGFNVGASCDGVGACGLGVIECATLTSTRCSTDPGGSASEVAPEICNSLDDDCDGAIDEGLADMGPCGITTGACEEGRLRCVAGIAACIGSIGPTPEVCDGVDNDCNGATDDAPIDVGATCGDDTGECEFGAIACVAGVPTCQGGTGPVPELCNGLDDDCNAITDDAPTDVGAPCGTTDVGECALGLTICLAGAPVCTGEIGPVPELCNGLDDDCDGAIDDAPLGVGAPCGVTVGVCSPGTFECVAGMLECVGEMGGTTEVCNGLDDDCNGLIDDDPPGVGGPCGETIGECEPGTTFCISGMLECVGGVTPTTEICNGLDDDCDLNIDEGDLCSGAVCINGECAAPCQPGEFGCPPGQACVDGFCLPDPCFAVDCPPSPDGTLNVCEEGLCVAACSLIMCAAPDVCRATDGLCVPDNCLFLPDKCAADEYCLGTECVSDPCHDVVCGATEFCRKGACVASCGGVECNVGEICHDGVCEPTGCAVDCVGVLICDPATGMCVENPCLDLPPCPVGEVCDPSQGACVEDLCAGIRCPGEEICKLGDCYDRPVPPAPIDGGTEYVYAVGGGCSVGSAGRGGGAALLVFVIALLLARRRAAYLALLVFASCSIDPFPLHHPGQGRDGGDGDGGGGRDGGVDATPADAGPACTPELCDEVDNDCDTLVDEGFDLQQDELNCGECGNTCSKPGSRTECLGGGCVIHECFPGFVDLDGDLGAPFETSNGCEYACFVSNGGVEVCDDLDNDCNGEVDETTDFDGDESNCGECGRVCVFFQASATCVMGSCTFDPATDCNPGFIDLNGAVLDGCEYACTTSAGGVEICDFLDNDCDGAIDEGFDLSMDPTDCGSCGRVCSFPHVSSPSCVMGTCAFDPATDCDAGFHDLNGLQLDGCEYACVGTPGGVEICDGIDNDCNGAVDGATTDSGTTCNRAPGGVATGDCTDTGTLTCVGGTLSCIGAPGPASETCNGEDDDCDGSIDESPVDVGSVCLAAVGACSAGIRTCVGGTLTCVQAVGPSPELCNGLDDDCDGSTDDSPTDPGLGGSCGTDTGACTAGTSTCVMGSIVCSGETPPTSEICNGIDDDCDGSIDNGPIDIGGSCGSGVGACVPGTVDCVGGMLTCTGGAGPGSETCNNLDDDCDGVTDEALSQSCYTGPSGTSGVGVCQAGVSTCSAGTFGSCAGQVVPSGETCDNQDDDCDGLVDDGVTQSCYSGPGGTAGVGICRAGSQACSGGVFSGPCSGEVTPAAEACNSTDDDCDGSVDEAAGGGPLTQTCYGGPGGTAGVGTCTSGTRTCAFGAFGTCVGEVTPATIDRCGDGLDTDCDTLGDTGEGCLGTSGGDLRLDAPGGGEGSTPGQFHSYDVSVVSAGNPAGTNVYVVWTDKRNGNADVFLLRSTNGGSTWANIQNLTSGIARPCVAPVVVAAFDPVLGQDRVYVAYQDVGVAAAGVRGLNVVRSANSGTTFSNPTTGLRLDTGSFDNFHHDLALNADGTRVVVAWEQLNTTTLTRTVRSRASSDSGVNFAAERLINVNSGATPFAGRPVAAITSTGRFVFAWRERRGGATQNVYATFSDSTSAAIPAANEDRLDADVMDERNADRPRIVAAGQNLYVVWEDISTLSAGGSDVSFARSTNNSVSWSAEQILDDPAGEISSSFAPSIAVDPRVAGVATDDRIYVVWEDDREGSQVYTTRSIDSGATFDPPMRASSQGDLPVAGLTREPRVSWVGGDSVVISYENEAGGTPHVYAAASIDSGLSWQVSDPRIDAGAGPATAPRVARAQGAGLTLGAVVVWIDFRTAPGINGDPYRRRFGR